MSMRANLRPEDRALAKRALTAWMTNDKPAFDQVLTEVGNDEAGATGVLLALLEYCDWVTSNTGPVFQPPDLS